MPEKRFAQINKKKKYKTLLSDSCCVMRETGHDFIYRLIFIKKKYKMLSQKFKARFERSDTNKIIIIIILRDRDE